MADVSSYALPPQKSPLEIAGGIADVQHKFQGLTQQQQQIESSGLTISNQKLELANKGLEYMSRSFGSLGPDATEAQYLKVAKDAVKLGLVPENTLHIFENKLNSYKKPDGKFDSNGFYNEAITTAANHQQQIQYHLGQSSNLDLGNATQPGVVSPKPGFGFRSAGPPVPMNPGPNRIEYGNNGQAGYRDVQPPQGAPGMPATPPAAPGFPGYVAPNANQNFRSGVSQDTPNNVVAQRTPALPSPLFEEGRKAYTADQENAASKMFAVQPAIQALALTKTPGFNSGPGTKAFQNVLATAKTWGLVDVNENDPTVAYQQVAKKLADYVSRSPVGQRSDAAQTLKEAASPNPGVQVLPALQKLTEDAIAMDRMEAARPGAFKTRNFEDYQNHRSLFPQSMDYRAFKLDQMGDEGPKLVKKMDAQLKKNPGDKEALKFFKSLDLAQKYYQ